MILPGKPLESMENRNGIQGIGMILPGKPLKSMKKTLGNKGGFGLQLLKRPF